jgi:replication-associated recombination protein RarA
MSEQAEQATPEPSELDRARARVAELEAAEQEQINDALDEAVEDVQEAAEEAAEEVAEVIEDVTGDPVTPDDQEVIAAVVADQVVEELAPELNPVEPVPTEAVAEVVVEDEPVAPDVPPVNAHWSERKLWGR